MPSTDASSFAGPIAITLTYIGLYYGCQINILRVKLALAKAYAQRGEKFDRYFGQDRHMLAADRLQLNTLEHMPPPNFHTIRYHGVLAPHAKAGHMCFWPLGDLEDLEDLGRMGLRQPPIVGEGVTAPGPEHGVDLILVPGLGFGRDGARLGFGAGHYDRALATRHGDPNAEMLTLCGVCPVGFVDPPGGPIPMLAHDLPMSYLATDEGVERCAVDKG